MFEHVGKHTDRQNTIWQGVIHAHAVRGFESKTKTS